MVCENCGQKEATCLYTEIISLGDKGKKTVFHLCNDCAEKKGGVSYTLGVPLNIGNLLAEVVGKSKADKALDLRCSTCGLTYSDFGKTGRLGCGECYSAFSSQLDGLLKRIHGNNRHRGKFPLAKGRASSHLSERSRPLDLGSRVSRLQEELKEAVRKEEFEKAAELRDRIAQMKEEGGG